jgi:predicted cupin superfamily sugar epimerase
MASGAVSADAQAIIDRLDLAPHPEGGHYRETWACPSAEGRAQATCIYFLLAAGERSHWHKVDADELWLWHAGAPLTLRIAADASGPARNHLLSGDPARGAPQICVPAHHWQAAETTGDWTLVSCVVSPGFRFDGFTLAPPEFEIPGGG